MAAKRSRMRRKEANEKVLTTQDDKSLGLEVKQWVRRGRGVVATRDFTKGDWILEYAGDLIGKEEEETRAKKYVIENKGSYTYMLSHNGKTIYIDATAESTRLGRLVNHSQIRCNSTMKKVVFNNKPHLVLVAATNIPSGAEILYDYNERRPRVVADNPWLSRAQEAVEEEDVLVDEAVVEEKNEILYDYNEDRPWVIRANPWLSRAFEEKEEEDMLLEVLYNEKFWE